ncbi:MAG: 2,3-bisphosphoglycerate-independent phosphoglycerate mutase [Patescibacteria group bacterium]
MKIDKRPIALIILDGFGMAPPRETNAISQAKKPFFDLLIKNYPTTLIEASGLSVGLPQGEFGNSEVGHLTLGSGIIRYQSLPRIDNTIFNGSFFNAPGLEKIAEGLHQNKNSKLHLMGLLGTGGVHSHQRHLEALLQWADQQKLNDRVYLHLFLDGRDTDKQSGLRFMQDILKFCKKNDVGRVASIGGRYYGMDRNHNWDRIELAYRAIVEGKSKNIFNDPIIAIETAYENKIFDEEIKPTVIVDKNDQPIATIDSGDSLIFFNFRADRAIQMTQALSQKKFNEFETKKLNQLSILTFTQYEDDLPVDVLFAQQRIENPLARILSQHKLKQIHLAETEKYAHITYFLNGGREEPFAGEDRILIPSPDVTSYDKKPEMSAGELTKNILKIIENNKHDFLAINYANPDMVAHTGNVSATVKAVEFVDQCLSKIIPAIEKKGGVAFVVGDHGNAEELVNLLTKQVDKEHNVYPVPFIGVGSNNRKGNFNQKSLALASPIGTLADVAPTILAEMGIVIPEEMSGQNLF